MKVNSYLFILLVIILFFNSINTQNAINYYVDTDGGDDGGQSTCTTSANPCYSILGAINKFKSSNNYNGNDLTFQPIIINIASGTYDGDNNTNIDLLRFNVEFVGHGYVSIQQSIAGINAFVNISSPTVGGYSTKVTFNTIIFDELNKHPVIYYDSNSAVAQQGISSTINLSFKDCIFSNIESKIAIFQVNNKTTSSISFDNVNVENADSTLSFPNPAGNYFFTFENIQSVYISNSSFTQMKYLGFIEANNSPLTINNTDISESTFNGTSIISILSSNAQFSGVRFDNITLANTTSTFYVIDSDGGNNINQITIKNSNFNGVNGGGVLSLAYANVQVSNIIVSNTDCKVCQGVAMSVYSDILKKASISISDSSFINSTGTTLNSVGTGSAVHIEYMTTATISSCQFNNNNGGGLFIKEVNATMKNTSFKNNYGSIYCDANLEFTDSSCTFTNNNISPNLATDFNGITIQGILCNTNSTLEKAFNNCTVSGPVSYQPTIDSINDICYFDVSISSKLNFSLFTIIFFISLIILN